MTMPRRLCLTDAEMGLACTMIEGSLEVQEDNNNAAGVMFLNDLLHELVQGAPVVDLTDDQVVWLREQLVDTFDDSEDGYETLKEKLA